MPNAGPGLLIVNVLWAFRRHRVLLYCREERNIYFRFRCLIISWDVIHMVLWNKNLLVRSFVMEHMAFVSLFVGSFVIILSAKESLREINIFVVWFSVSFSLLWIIE